MRVTVEGGDGLCPRRRAQSGTPAVSMREVIMTDESRTRGTAPHGSDAPGDREGRGTREAHGADAPLQSESSGDNSSGTDAVDSLTEGARPALRDAQVAYGEEQTYGEAGHA